MTHHFVLSHRHTNKRFMFGHTIPYEQSFWCHVMRFPYEKSLIIVSRHSMRFPYDHCVTSFQTISVWTVIGQLLAFITAPDSSPRVNSILFPHQHFSKRMQGMERSFHTISVCSSSEFPSRHDRSPTSIPYYFRISISRGYQGVDHKLSTKTANASSGSVTKWWTTACEGHTFVTFKLCVVGNCVLPRHVGFFFCTQPRVSRSHASCWGTYARARFKT